MCPQSPIPGPRVARPRLHAGQRLGYGRVLTVSPGNITHRGSQRTGKPGFGIHGSASGHRSIWRADDRLRSGQIPMRLLWADETAFRATYWLLILR
jgi:hypothetical protein